MTGPGDGTLRETFFAECEDLLEAIQDGLDDLAVGTADGEAINSVFRAVHSIKGGAGAFGFDGLVAFAHRFETALDTIRSGARAPDADLLDLFRHCGDALSDFVTAAQTGGAASPPAAGALQTRLGELAGDGDDDASRDRPDFMPIPLDLSPGGPDAAAPARRRYTISFNAEPSLFAAGNDPAVLMRALAGLGDLAVEAALDNVPPLAALDPDQCHIDWTATLVTDATEARIHEVFEFVEDDCRLRIERIPDPPAEAKNAPLTVATGPVPALADLVAPTGPAPEPAQSGGEARSGGTIRVELDRIDGLINLAGEFVIKEAMLSQSIQAHAPGARQEVAPVLDSFKQLADDIQDGVMGIRAQPVKPVFQRMARIVRETGAATGKRVRLVTVGDDTEVDRTVIERLVDPLTHMVRNAIAHGLEPQDSRSAAGKPRDGTVTLSASHRSGRVLIDVSDDGGGIDRDRVRQIAVSRGMIAEGEGLAPDEIDNLLFQPGFSSCEDVSDLSGRGVGLDVVRTEIHRLGGRVSVQSDPGDGTTFSISLPLTLAVMEGMVIRVAGQTLVMPVSAIRETVRAISTAIHDIGPGGRVLRDRGGVVPVIDLGAVLGFRAPEESFSDHVMLLIESGLGQRYALVIDGILDQRQVVIKSLEQNYAPVAGIAAATILGDGRIALILDPDTLVRRGAGAGPGCGSPFLQMAVHP